MVAGDGPMEHWHWHIVITSLNQKNEKSCTENIELVSRRANARELLKIEEQKKNEQSTKWAECPSGGGCKVILAGFNRNAPPPKKKDCPKIIALLNDAAIAEVE